MTGGRLIAQIGRSDCEHLRDGVLAQPVNALTALSFVVVGAFVAASATRTGRERLRSAVFAASLVAVGVGSVLFHGPQPTGAAPMHDVPIVITLLFVAGHDALGGRSPARTELAIFAGVSALAAVIIVAELAPSEVVTGAAVAMAAVGELAVTGRRFAPLAPRLRRRIFVAVGVVAGIGGASWILGRTGGPLCDPQSVLQPHGLWHVAAAAAAGLWWWVAVTTAPAPDR